MNDAFRRAARYTSNLVGSTPAFIFAFLVVLLWAVSGPLFQFSDTWQLVINTGTTIVTFLMVFLIQNTQNRDSRAMHMKLDELILITQGADNSLVRTERLSDEQIDHMERHYYALARALGKREALDTEANRQPTQAKQRRRRAAASNGAGPAKTNIASKHADT